MLLKTQNQNHQHHRRIPWKLRIQAKAKHFNFNLSLKFASPSFSLPSNFYLRQCRLALALALDFGSSKTTIKSKLLRIFRKFRRTRAQKPHCPQNGLIKWVWVFLVAAILVSSFGYPLRRVLSFDEAAILKLIDKAWNYAANFL